MALALGCQPGGASNADSVATASVSSTPPVMNAPPDSVAAKATTSVSPATSTDGKKAASRTTPAKSPGTPQTKAPVLPDTILGWDSVIRGPIRTVPRPSATPTRE